MANSTQQMNATVADLQKQLDALESNNNNQLVQNEKKSDEKKSDKTLCLIAIALNIVILSIIAAYITYFVYCIIALSKISDKTIRKHCEGSILWRYVLSSIIVPNAVSIISNNKSKDDNNVSKLFTFFIAGVIMTVFGAIEFHTTDYKDNFNNNNQNLLYNGAN